MTNRTIANHARFFQEFKDINSHYEVYVSHLRERISSQEELDAFRESMNIILAQYFFHLSVLEAAEANHSNPFLPRRRQG